LAAIAGEDKPVERWEIPTALLGDAVAVNRRFSGNEE